MKIWKLPAKTAAMARAGLGSQRSLQKKGKNMKKHIDQGLSAGSVSRPQAEHDESTDIAIALAASMEAHVLGKCQVTWVSQGI